MVQSIMKVLVTGPNLKTNDNTNLVKFSDDVGSAIETLEYLSEDGERDYKLKAESADNISKILRRMPNSWRNEVLNKTATPTLHDISTVLERRTKNLSSAMAMTCATVSSDKERGGGGPYHGGNPKYKNAKVNFTGTVDCCKFCEGTGHQLKTCRGFEKTSATTMRNFLRKENLCFNCYGSHMAKDCEQASSCQAECTWNSKHDPRLHNVRKAKSENQTSTTDVETEVIAREEEPGSELSSESESEVEVTSSTRARATRKDHLPYFPVIPVRITAASGKQVTTFGCLDTMSSVHCADERLLRSLGINPPATKTVFSTITGKKEVTTRVADLRVQGLYSKQPRVLLKAVEFIPGHHLERTPVPKPEAIEKYEHLQGLGKCFGPLELDHVSLLIGASANPFFAPESLKTGAKAEPIGVKTALGWTIFGGSDGDSLEDTWPMVNAVCPSDLERDLSKLWDIESTGDLVSPRVGMSRDDGKALAILENSTRLRNGHYEISLLWKAIDPRFPDNRAFAERLLIQRKRKFLKDPAYLEMYSAQVLYYLQNGFARIVPEDEKPPEPGQAWYVVHHAVSHPRKPGQLRLVFNCSSEYRGTSLNGKLYAGPDFINLLVGVLLRFRTGKWAVSADIRAMYLNVRVPPSQTSYLRWLWFQDSDPRAKTVELEMLVHLFGCLSSSSCANYALRQCASQFEKSSPEYEEILRNFYVDDYLSSFDEMDNARRIVHNVFEGLKSGGFTLTKFCANNSELLNGIPQEHLVCGNKVSDSAEDTSVEKTLQVKGDSGVPEQVTLGVRWDPHKDAFIFRAVSMNLVCTKRGVLSAIARVVHDPCGLVLAVIVLPARLLFQELCRRGAQWDEPLTEEEEQIFRKWYGRLDEIGNMEIPRFIRPKDFGEVVRREVHIFSDASEKCYGACCYVREVNETGEVSCALVFAKSRLAPLRRTLTLVRLELQGAVTAVHAKELVMSELDVPVDDVYFWVDSMPVLGYIQNDEKRYQVFVANRVARINASTSKSQWKWIKSGLNVSDVISRGLADAEILNVHHIWFKGPEFLHRTVLDVPPPMDTVTVPEDDPELRRRQSVFVTAVKDSETRTFVKSFLVKFKNLQAAKMAVTIMRKFIDYKTRHVSPSKITISDLSDAERMIVKIAQKDSFPEEYQRLNQKPAQKLNKDSPLYKLSPFIGQVDGLIRVGGRLTKSHGSYDFKHPIVLPKRHHVTEALVREYHALTGHGSVKMILNEMRIKYYVVNGKSAVHAVWNKCLRCKRQRVQPGNQFMHVLPENRVKPFEPAFTSCAVDIFGHFFVKIGRSNVKRWVAAFICENCKAVHLEMLYSMDTSAFMNALRKMMGRRGRIHRLTSDQGSNLKAASKEISAAIKEWNNSGMEQRLRQYGVEWMFTPATASHMNGLAERIIRSSRDVLVHLLQDQTLTDDSLQTLLVECEAILNHRPICELSTDPDDTRALTPAHLVQPRVEEIDLPPGIFSPDDNIPRRRWRQVQYLADIFWKRMIREHYQLLQKRQKWLNQTRNLAINDLVLVMDTNLHRNDWKYGRVVKVKTSDDGLVRSCTVRTNTGMLERPIVKLCLMEGAAA